MMNLIGTLVVAYFLTGLLLYVRVMVKAYAQVKIAISNCSDLQTFVTKRDETFNEVCAEFGLGRGAVMTTGSNIFNILWAFVTWPVRIQKFEEVVLLTARRLVENTNHT